MDALDFPDADRSLSQFAPGETMRGVVLAVREMQVVAQKNGGVYLALKLRDGTGERNAKWFNAPPDSQERFGTAQFVSVWGIVDTAERYRGDLKLSKLEATAAPADLSRFLPPLPGDHKAHKARFREIIAGVKNPHLRALLDQIFDPKGDFWPRFCEAPAAAKMHHAHRGGLLEHSGEVALLCDRVASTLCHLDRDLLVTCALLHDIGKLEEMETLLETGATIYTPAGQLVGHIVLGTCTVASAAEKIVDFPPKLKHEVMHLILSHHGEPEFGAARRPACAEALILSLCDLMSAKVAQCRDLANCEGDDHFPRLNNWNGIASAPLNNVYIGLMRELMNGEAG